MADEFYIRDPMSPGMCGEDVRYFQEGLRRAGLDVALTGIFDPETEAAWREAQIRARLNVFDEVERFHGPWDEQTKERFAERYPNSYEGADEDVRGRERLANSPWEFGSREEYREFLESDPSPLLEDVYRGGYVGLGDAHRWAYERWFDKADGQGGVRTPEDQDELDNLTEFSEWSHRYDVTDSKGWPTYPKDFFRDTDVAPPGSDSCLIADAGAGSSITNLALYEEVRKQLPKDIGDDRAAEATLRAMQDGIKTPEQMHEVVVANDRIFVVGNVPGFRGVVDLSQPPLPTAEIGAQFASLEQNSQNERQSVERRSHSLG